MIEGKKVGLRGLEEYDLPILMNWRNDPKLRKFFREVKEINSANQKIWFDSVNQKNSCNKMFSIVRLEDNNLLGAAGLCYIDWINRSADFSIYIGYGGLYIDENYATEAAQLMLKYAFNILNLHRLWAEIYSIDRAKKKFFEDLGFTLDGVFRESYWYEGRWHNSLIYSFLSKEFRND